MNRQRLRQRPMLSMQSSKLKLKQRQMLSMQSSKRKLKQKLMLNMLKIKLTKVNYHQQNCMSEVSRRPKKLRMKPKNGRTRIIWTLGAMVHLVKIMKDLQMIHLIIVILKAIVRRNLKQNSRLKQIVRQNTKQNRGLLLKPMFRLKRIHLTKNTWI